MEELRKANGLIPKITAADSLSKEWAQVVKVITSIAKLVGSEREAKTLAQSPIVMSMLRQKKLHALVHMFESYRAVMADSKEREAKINSLKQSEDIDDAKKVLKAFEMDTHIILNHAFKFLMIHQRSNFDSIFGLYAGMLVDCLKDSEESKKVLICGVDFTSFSVLKSLLRTVVHIGSFDEDRMMDPIKKHNVVNLVIMVVHSRMTELRAFAAAAAVMFLDVCFDTDAFTTTPADFISKENHNKLAQINEYVAKPLTKLEMLKKKPRNVSRWAGKLGQISDEDVEVNKELLKSIMDQLTLTAKVVIFSHSINTFIQHI